MTEKKSFKKAIIFTLVIVVLLSILSLPFNGINTVPFKYRYDSVSFLTPNLKWGNRVSSVVLKYGLPDEISRMSDITGERSFDFSFSYDEKDVTMYVTNRYLLNSVPHHYSFAIDCKTPEEANKYFDECHKKIMDLYKDEPDFEFEGTFTETDYEFTDGNVCSYYSTNENGTEKTFIIDDNGNEIPIEDVDNVIEINTKTNEYDMCNTTGVNYSLAYTEGDSYVILRANILYWFYNINNQPHKDFL